ncbi:MAG: ferrochelatase [Candidatus Wallbacteria bacterium]|nr:ferrochelatase [Candidatus Wallbacteria bacterium]
MTSRTPYDSVLMIGFGGPTEPGHSEEFVRRIVGNRPGMDQRILEVARHYEEFGGISPYNERTFAKARGLEERLRARGADVRVLVGMRFWEPYARDVLRSMAAQDLRSAIGIVLSVHQCSASWDKYIDTVSEGMAELGERAFRVDYLEPFHLSDGFVEAVADNIRSHCLRELGPDRFRSAALVFTAHSVPVSVASEAPYVQQFADTAAAVAERLERPGFALAYQSAAGGRVPWLGPDVSAAIRSAAERGAKDVIVSPIGFLCDHVEVLYDLDIVARETARQAGLGYVRPRTVETHPAFLDQLARLVLAKLELGD